MATTFSSINAGHISYYGDVHDGELTLTVQESIDGSVDEHKYTKLTFKNLHDWASFLVAIHRIDQALSEDIFNEEQSND